MKKLIVVAMVLLPGVALAQTKVVQEPDTIAYRNVTHIDMTGSDADAIRDRPTGSYKVIPRAAKFPSRIQLRADFQPELQASADALH